MRVKTIALLVALGATAYDASAANRPTGFTTICSENKTCSVASATSVAFGRAGQFSYKTLSGSFVCSEAIFGAGSRVAGGVNECSVPSSGASSSSSSKASSSAASSQASSASSSKASSSAASSKSSASSSAASSAASSQASSSASSTSTACKTGAVFDGVTVDCGGVTVGTSCDGDAEGQDAVISLKNGAVVSNLHVKAGGGAHGISCLAGNCTLKNVTWDEVCEHAAGNYSAGGTYSIYDSVAYQNLDALAIDGGKPDKFFQDNAIGSTMYVRNFTAIMVDTTGAYSSSGKILRTCGDCSANGGPRTLDLDGLTVKHVKSDRVTTSSGNAIDSIVGINSKWDSTVPSSVAVPDKATLRNVKIQGYKLGSDGKKSTPKVCVTYIGSRTHNGSSSIDQEWNTTACNVSTSDVTSF